MESVIKAVIVYFVLLLIFRVVGRRTLAESSPFDIILLLIISEAIQQALTDNDNSIINGIIVVITLVFCDIVISLLKQSSKKIEKLVEGMALIVVENGKPLKDRMNISKVDIDDIMEAARESGLERMDQIKFAVLEKDGNITIIPKLE